MEDSLFKRYIIKLISTVLVTVLNAGVQILLPRALSVAEYIKNAFFNNNYNIFNELLDYLHHNYLSIMEVKLLVARLLYPSFYFDMYDQIISGRKDEKELNNIISRISEYEYFLYK